MTKSAAETLNQRTVPKWFEDAKLGIFIHWGLFSVPGFAPRVGHVSDSFTKHYRLSAVMTPYTEWYDNAIRVPESPSAEHHAAEWGGRPYSDFKQPFSAGLEDWDPVAWARLFRRAGARYVVLVSKHHDGFCLWPTAVANPHRQGWASERDVVGDLAAAVRAEGLRFGVYYSGGIDWSFNPRPVRTLVEFVSSVPGGDYPRYAEAQVRELIERYEPEVLWNDISWPTGSGPMLQLMEDYYAAVPDGVVNDRWMHRGFLLKALGWRPVQKLLDAILERRIARQVEAGTYTPGLIPPKPLHCDFRTPEYTSFPRIVEKKWEATRGMSSSFGYNRSDREEHYEDPVALVQSFIDTVSKNGNLLLNVGPRGEDATIPEMQVKRLEVLGDWLSQNGAAIYDTRPWRVAEAETWNSLPVRFTSKGAKLYVIVLGVPAATVRINVPGELSVGPIGRRLSDGAEVGVAREGEVLVLHCGVKAGSGIAESFELVDESMAEDAK